MPKTAAVAIDEYKLPTFKKHLDDGGYKYTVHPGLTADTLTLRVEYEWVAKLLPVIEAANAESRKADTP